MFQVRYVSGGLLFLKPLGTLITMLPKHCWVKDFETRNTYFQQVFICLNSMSYGQGSVNGLWIKHCHNVPSCDTETKMRRLVIRPGGIGDFILSLPALEHLRTEYFEVWAAGPNVPLIRFADRARSIASTGLDLLGVTVPPARLLDELRRFDSIVSWYGAKRPDLCTLVRSLGLPFQFHQALPPEGAGLHATDFYLDQVGARRGALPRILCEVERENFAAIHPFSGSPRKNWPLEKFRAMAGELERAIPVRWCAGPDDPPLESGVYIDDLYELACWLARAQLYVGNDSGITHLAAAVGTPVLALFGPTDPAVWAPRGPHVRVALWE
jgi:heptosyltransferase-3